MNMALAVDTFAPKLSSVDDYARTVLARGSNQLTLFWIHGDDCVDRRKATRR
jgi:hypothetical protein